MADQENPIYLTDPVPVTPDWPDLSMPEAGFAILFGGTFDPPTRAHRLVALAARLVLERTLNAPGLGYLVLVPAGQSPHKSTQPIAGAGDRTSMLASAFRGQRRIAVWTIEALAPAGIPTYTIDTVVAASRAGARRLRLLIGEDQAAAFHRWKDARGILELAEPAVALRPGSSVVSLRSVLLSCGFWSTDEVDQWMGRILDVPPFAGSATAFREAAKAGDSAAMSRLVDPDVLEFIRRRRLYGA